MTDIDHGYDPKAKTERLVSLKAAFAEAVPADLAERATPIEVSGDRLIIECDKSTVAQQLAFLSSRILAACSVAELRFRVKARGRYE